MILRGAKEIEIRSHWGVVSVTLLSKNGPNKRLSVFRLEWRSTERHGLKFVKLVEKDMKRFINGLELIWRKRSCAGAAWPYFNKVLMDYVILYKQHDLNIRERAFTILIFLVHSSC